jgi:hypothetical protein
VDGEKQLIMSAPVLLREICRLIPFPAKQISLDSPFKEGKGGIWFSGQQTPAFSEEIGKPDLRNFSTMKGFQKDAQIIGPR